MHVQGGVREESLEEGHEFMRQTHLPLGMNNERFGAAAWLYRPQGRRDVSSRLHICSWTDIDFPCPKDTSAKCL